MMASVYRFSSFGLTPALHHSLVRDYPPRLYSTAVDSVVFVRFVVVGTESRVNYTPMNELDYGTLLCWANNSVGYQAQPCVFHILPAGWLAHNTSHISLSLFSLSFLEMTSFIYVLIASPSFIKFNNQG